MALPARTAGKILLDEIALDRTLSRIAHEIIERNADLDDVALVGIHTRGVPLAQRLRRLVEERAGVAPALGTVDITFYRDDVQVRGGEAPLHAQPVVRATQLDFPLEGRTVVLVDDVLYTGRTIRAAIDALFDYGRPARVQLAVLVDRGHRELPIRPDYVGKNLPTSREERIQVQLLEVDEVDQVLLISADTMSIKAAGSSVDKGESLKDTALTIGAYDPDVIVIRHPQIGAPHLVARHTAAHVVNAGDGKHQHPTQALLDLYTIQEEFQRIDGLHVAIVGDVLYVLRMQRERMEEGANYVPSLREYTARWGVTPERLRPGQKVMHPGPMNRGVEIDGRVADAADALVETQVRAGLVVRMAVLYDLLTGGPVGVQAVAAVEVA